MKEEEFIKSLDKGHNPFRVPEGYFESLTPRIMAAIARAQAADPAASGPEGRAPEAPGPQPSAPRTAAFRPWRRALRYAAVAVAGVLGAAAAVAVYDRTQPAVAALADADAEYTLSDDIIDDALDYEMVNNQQIAYYLTAAY